jgi:hypothetical protein
MARDTSDDDRDGGYLESNVNLSRIREIGDPEEGESELSGQAGDSGAEGPADRADPEDDDTRDDDPPGTSLDSPAADPRTWERETPDNGPGR